MRSILVMLTALVATTAQAEDARQSPAAISQSANPMTTSDTWNEIKADLIGTAEPKSAESFLTIGLPYRAEDAATVPLTLNEAPGHADAIRAVKLIIDENPSPLAADIRFGAAMLPLKFETRIRVNQYSNVRAVVSTTAGEYMTGRFVKASGGCSAPATKDPETAKAGMGEMKLRVFDSAGPRRDVQLMIRHPNYSGLQRDQITHLFIGAQFIHTLEVRQGKDLLFAIDGGISISENPAFRFSFHDNGAPSLSVHAVDTDGNVFDRDLPLGTPA
ncbi:quinoprotein dehydrogenase-associated SoxYZ-like carrier [Rhizobium halophytocola]|uniref:Sulfur-oxidizing protein SoxY n=1 Tax=Rhizobium halophytocola TaxID=735519 RepID=A0ABS4DSZ4_9HYPH|nr:quinoprotein dehydrogenase-associated SoxYZ-like carrier [Rhizobium halophytocola]MBP1848800.1 sulfur-oxidizing protein SoxY [Rhizobium halophytocola]